MNGPEGSALIRELRPGDTVITPKLDRMFRSALDALGILAKLKAAWHRAAHDRPGRRRDGNGVSKLVFTILSAVAETERDRTRERITEVKADQKQRGRFLGGIAPFGYRKGAMASLSRSRANKGNPQDAGTAGGGGHLRAISEALKADRIKLSHVGVGNALEAATQGGAE